MKITKSPAVRRWVRRGAVAASLLLIVSIGVLETLRFVAYRRGVSAVDLPVGSEIRQRAAAADYTDAYSALVEGELNLDGVTFGLGREVVRTSYEVVYEGGAPGLRYLASYHLEPGPPQRFTLSTVVFYESVIGPVYFFPVRFVHRRGVPFMLSRMLSKQASAG